MFSRIASDVVIVPIFAAGELADVRRRFDEAVLTFPEFHHPPAGSGVRYPYVPGSFGAFRNPANFHCEFARAMRARIHEPAKAAIGESGKSFAQLFDSLRFLLAGMQFQGESWHRDSHPMGGTIWGGWVNMDDHAQIFRCVPDSTSATGRGFGAENEPPAHLQRDISVPPGSMILFRQDILHCIIKSKMAYNSYKMYVGFRISEQLDAIYDAEHIIAEQRSPPLPSGEIPAMYSLNHNSCLLYSHTIPWSECIVQDWIKEPRMIGGEEMFICPRHIYRGLVWYDLAYPAYSPEDIAIMTPQMI